MEMTKFDGARQFLFKDVEFNYYKEKPVTYKGVQQWEVSIKTKNAEKAQEWEREHLNIRHNGTSTTLADTWTVSLNRKVFKKDGEAQEPVRIVDENLTPYTPEERRKIGNGSIGNLIVWQGHYSNEHGDGVSTSLTAMQIPRATMEVYEGSMDTVDFANLGTVASSDDSGEAATEQLF